MSVARNTLRHMNDRHVFEDRVDEDGTHRHSAAYLSETGALVISTHDLGPGVQEFFGMSEYEAEETFSVEQTARMREALGEDLIAAIAERFPESGLDLAKYAESIGIGRGKIWNRIGD
ncbi:hypothetical protein A5768_22330 [Mycolicibacterium fortuitum]|nr:hypothetical protein A5768_22330 [Mycolicibacterium fortuitum]